ncbi:MAG: DUF2061 domain-containing protein [Flavobacteriales bacterium]|jgi:uncharacterized membrane protein|uniref:DUF2061 domain-containing protein n=1 Tax=Candidatus Ulvibacter alkanivorans TaxID=2267620 RepID=UPI000DF451E5|nr:DUF2061 domain-containing protein [Candidatus Ulvibacter alkanivorans]MCH2490734.1 DUF2061 domain-containing protein [Flavobacteriales bacterium]
MAAIKQESHLRSLLKGISWRVIATTDTILVTLLITCLMGVCSIEDALKIGAAEFLIKFFIYYAHERFWQRYRDENGFSPRKVLYKTITWRVVATTTTFIIAGTVLNTFNEVALFIALTELITKFALYYFHEQLWLRLPLGKIRNYFYKKIGR